MDPPPLPVLPGAGQSSIATSGPPGLPGLTVAAVARRLGIAPATLRTWARRYGLGPSAHVAGSHRRYSGEDFARLDLMRRMVDAGVSPGDAARAARSAAPDLLSPDAIARAYPDRGWPAGTTAGASPSGRVLEGDITHLAAVPDIVEGDPEAGGTGPGPGGRVGAAGGAPAARTLARAALALDARACADVITERLERRGVLWTWEQLLAPVLVEIGARWEQTGAGIEVEHLVSESIISAMGSIRVGPDHHATSRPVLLSCAEEEQHSLPLFVLAAALAERQVEASVLGARVPHHALVAAVRRVGPVAVLLWSATAGTGELSVLSDLPALRPAPLLLVGGQGWQGDPPAGVDRVHDLADAVDRICGAVA